MEGRLIITVYIDLDNIALDRGSEFTFDLQKLGFVIRLDLGDDSRVRLEGYDYRVKMKHKASDVLYSKKIRQGLCASAPEWRKGKGGGSNIASSQPRVSPIYFRTITPGLCDIP